MGNLAQTASKSLWAYWLTHGSAMRATDFLAWSPGWDHGERNVVLFWLAKDTPAAAREQMRKDAVDSLKNIPTVKHVFAGKPANTIGLPLAPDEKLIVASFQLLTDKPAIFAANVKEQDLAAAHHYVATDFEQQDRMLLQEQECMSWAKVSAATCKGGSSAPWQSRQLFCVCP